MVTCTQKSDCGHECGRPHHATLHWPGDDDRPVCYSHAVKAARVAEALGCWYLGILTWTPEGVVFSAAWLVVVAGGGDPMKLYDEAPGG